MPYAAPHNLMVIYGGHSAGPDADVWSMGVRFGSESEQGVAVRDDVAAERVLDHVSASVQAWWDRMANNLPTTTTLSGVKVNAIGTDGRYVLKDKTYQRDFATPLPGRSAASTALPAQLSCVVTLRTASSRGRASKGRVYLPPMASNVLAGSRIAAGNADLFATTFAQLLSAVNAPPTGTGDLGRAIVASDLGLGITRHVVSVDVGDRVDVQRRRANALREVRSALKPVTN